MPVDLEIIKYISKKRSEQASEIERFLREREITSLYHFTRVQNIPNIISYGLRSRNLLSGIPHVCSDDVRYDGHYWGASFSMGAPQMFMLRNKVKTSPYRDFVLLEFSPRALLEEDYIAFPGNAASSAVSNYFEDAPHRLGGFEGLRRMFLAEDTRNQQELAKYETSDAQAEIMFLQPVSWEKYFTSMFLQDYYSRDAFDLVSKMENVNQNKVNRLSDYDSKKFLDYRFEFDRLTQLRFETKFSPEWTKN